MKPTAEFDRHDLTPATTRIPEGNVRPVTNQYPSWVFIVDLSPAREISRYNDLAKQGVSIWWMSACVDEELFTLYMA